MSEADNNEPQQQAPEVARKQTPEELVKEQLGRLSNYKKDKQLAARVIMHEGVYLPKAQDRLNVLQWLRKLDEMNDSIEKEAAMKHDYLQYLRMMLCGDFHILARPFSLTPPEKLLPFAECLANTTAALIPGVPRVGRLQPVMMHKSEDNRAFMTVRRTDNGSLLCYMAVAPNALNVPPQ